MYVKRKHKHFEVNKISFFTKRIVELKRSLYFLIHNLLYKLIRMIHLPLPIPLFLHIIISYETFIVTNCFANFINYMIPLTNN